LVLCQRRVERHRRRRQARVQIHRDRAIVGKRAFRIADTPILDKGDIGWRDRGCVFQWHTSALLREARKHKERKASKISCSFALSAVTKISSPPGADFARVALGGDDTAAVTDTERNTSAILGLEPFAATAVAADTEILDVIGAPELRREQQLQVVAGGEDADLHTDSRRENFLDAGEELLPIRVDIVADA